MEHWPKELVAMVDAAKLAGAEIRASWDSRGAGASQGPAMVTKSNSADIQTETDRRCEELVSTHLRSAFPSYKIIGEEATAESGSFELTAARTFVIDPIDGTTNFVHTLLSCSVLIAFMNERRVDASVVFDPIHDELFYAWRGGGAWLERAGGANPLRLAVSGEVEVSKAIVHTDNGACREPEGVEAFLSLQRSLFLDGGVRGVRITGGCGLGLAYVAAGRADAYVERSGPYLWDFAGGSLLVEEAGGVCMDPTSTGPVNWEGRDILAAGSRELALAVHARISGASAPPRPPLES